MDLILWLFGGFLIILFGLWLSQFLSTKIPAQFTPILSTIGSFLLGDGRKLFLYAAIIALGLGYLMYRELVNLVYARDISRLALLFFFALVFGFIVGYIIKRGFYVYNDSMLAREIAYELGKKTKELIDKVRNLFG